MTMVRYLLLGLVFLVTSQAAPNKIQEANEVCNDANVPFKRIVCYYDNSINRYYGIDDVDPCLCTHLVYSHVTFEPANNWTLVAKGKPNNEYKVFSLLKKKNPWLMTMVSIKSDRSVDVTDNGTDVDVIADKIVQFIGDNNLDGVDLDLQGMSGGTPVDGYIPNKDGLTSLLKALRVKMDSSIQKDEDPFLLSLTVSKNPHEMVYSYDISNITDFVDFFNLPAFNFTNSSRPEIKHPSRLHGIADIENADSLVDLLLTLGAPSDKVVVGSPMHGTTYKLHNASMTTPGSPSDGAGEVGDVSNAPGILYYDEICNKRKAGNWTLVREQDQTAPYLYKDDQWVGFEDEISMKLKSKYIVLRQLGGVMLSSINTDDYKGHCGMGKYPLLSSVHDVFTGQKTEYNNETDPFDEYLAESRIVTVVDKESGAHHVLPAPHGDTVGHLTCTRQGYYRNPYDCTKFYRCVKFNQLKDEFTTFEYDCPHGLVFDERYEVCSWPSWSPACGGSGEILPVPRSDFVCPSYGYHRDPENCRWFYYCADLTGNGYLEAWEFKCPFDLAFDEDKILCNWKWLVPGCGGRYGQHPGPVGIIPLKPKLPNLSGQSEGHLVYGNRGRADNLARGGGGGGGGGQGYVDQRVRAGGYGSNGQLYTGGYGDNGRPYVHVVGPDGGYGPNGPGGLDGGYGPSGPIGPQGPAGTTKQGSGYDGKHGGGYGIGVEHGGGYRKVVKSGYDEKQGSGYSTGVKHGGGYRKDVKSGYDEKHGSGYSTGAEHGGGYRKDVKLGYDGKHGSGYGIGAEHGGGYRKDVKLGYDGKHGAGYGIGAEHGGGYRKDVKLGYDGKHGAGYGIGVEHGGGYGIGVEHGGGYGIGVEHGGGYRKDVKSGYDGKHGGGYGIGVEHGSGYGTGVEHGGGYRKDVKSYRRTEEWNNHGSQIPSGKNPFTVVEDGGPKTILVKQGVIPRPRHSKLILLDELLKRRQAPQIIKAGGCKSETLYVYDKSGFKPLEQAVEQGGHRPNAKFTFKVPDLKTTRGGREYSSYLEQYEQSRPQYAIRGGYKPKFGKPHYPHEVRGQGHVNVQLHNLGRSSGPGKIRYRGSGLLDTQHGRQELKLSNVEGSKIRRGDDVITHRGPTAEDIVVDDLSRGRGNDGSYHTEYRSRTSGKFTKSGYTSGQANERRRARLEAEAAAKSNLGNVGGSTIKVNRFGDTGGGQVVKKPASNARVNIQLHDLSKKQNAGGHYVEIEHGQGHGAGIHQGSYAGEERHGYVGQQKIKSNAEVNIQLHDLSKKQNAGGHYVEIDHGQGHGAGIHQGSYAGEERYVEQQKVKSNAQVNIQLHDLSKKQNAGGHYVEIEHGQGHGYVEQQKVKSNAEVNIQLHDLSKKQNAGGHYVEIEHGQGHGAGIHQGSYAGEERYGGQQKVRSNAEVNIQLHDLSKNQNAGGHYVEIEHGQDHGYVEQQKVKSNAEVNIKLHDLSKKQNTGGHYVEIDHGQGHGVGIHQGSYAGEQRHGYVEQQKVKSNAEVNIQLHDLSKKQNAGSHYVEIEHGQGHGAEIHQGSYAGQERHGYVEQQKVKSNAEVNIQLHDLSKKQNAGGHYVEIEHGQGHGVGINQGSYAGEQRHGYVEQQKVKSNAEVNIQLHDLSKKQNAGGHYVEIEHGQGHGAGIHQGSYAGEQRHGYVEQQKVKSNAEVNIQLHDLSKANRNDQRYTEVIHDQGHGAINRQKVTSNAQVNIKLHDLSKVKESGGGSVAIGHEAYVVEEQHGYGENEGAKSNAQVNIKLHDLSNSRDEADSYQRSDEYYGQSGYATVPDHGYEQGQGEVVSNARVNINLHDLSRAKGDAGYQEQYTETGHAQVEDTDRRVEQSQSGQGKKVSNARVNIQLPNYDGIRRNHKYQKSGGTYRAGQRRQSSAGGDSYDIDQGYTGRRTIGAEGNKVKEAGRAAGEDAYDRYGETGYGSEQTVTEYGGKINQKKISGGESYKDSGRYEEVEGYGVGAKKSTSVGYRESGHYEELDGYAEEGYDQKASTDKKSGRGSSKTRHEAKAEARGKSTGGGKTFSGHNSETGYAKTDEEYGYGGGTAYESRGGSARLETPDDRASSGHSDYVNVVLEGDEKERRTAVYAGPRQPKKEIRREKEARFVPSKRKGDADDTLPNAACTRPGIFRHPDDCNKFYECYWDKTINKFTLHMFECPIKLVFDQSILGCASPHWGPKC
ncbi:Uncharacterised protein g8129 [Pycnogonum litorale]